MMRRLFQGVEGVVDATEQLCSGMDSSALIPDPCSLFPVSEKLHEECGVVAIHGHPDAARQAYLALYALQHRGQESAGIATADGQRLANIKGMGLVSEIFTDDVLAKLPGSMAIGHTRYSTTGDSALLNAQPIRVDSTKGLIAIAHNGNLVNLGNLRSRLERDGAYFQTTSDSEIIVQLIAHSHAGSLVDAIADSLAPDRRRIFHRDDDPRPDLCCPRSARLPAALDGPHPEPRRLRIRSSLPRRPAPSTCCAPNTCAMCCPANWSWSPKTASPAANSPPALPQSSCIFEHVYFARPDSRIFGRWVQESRDQMGRQLARESGVPADVVVPVPDSGVTAALGYAEEAGIPFRFGLIRNHYVGRTFIEPEQRVRDFGVRLKLNPVRNLLEGKRVVLIDDSIIRGTTSRKIVRMVRGAGAKRSPSAHQLPAHRLALLLRRRYSQQARPDRRQQVHRRDSPLHRGRFAGLSLSRRPARLLPGRRAHRLLHRLLHRQLSHPVGRRGRHSAGDDEPLKAISLLLQSGFEREWLRTCRKALENQPETPRRNTLSSMP